MTVEEPKSEGADETQSRPDRGRSPDDYLDPETKKFKKGNPGGPGRKLGEHISLLAEVRSKLRKNPEQLGRIADNLLSLAEEGNGRALRAIMVLFNRLDGPVSVVIDDRRETKAGMIVLDHRGRMTIEREAESEVLNECSTDEGTDDGTDSDG